MRDFTLTEIDYNDWHNRSIEEANLTRRIKTIEKRVKVCSVRMRKGFREEQILPLSQLPMRHIREATNQSYMTSS